GDGGRAGRRPLPVRPRGGAVRSPLERQLPRPGADRGGVLHPDLPERREDGGGEEGALRADRGEASGLARAAQGGRAGEPRRGPARKVVVRRRGHELPTATVIGHPRTRTGRSAVTLREPTEDPQ